MEIEFYEIEIYLEIDLLIFGIYQKGFDAIFPITDKPMPLSLAISDAALLLEDSAERIARMLLLSPKYF